MPGEIELTQEQKLKQFIKLYEDYPRSLVMHKLNLDDLSFDQMLRFSLHKKIITNKKMLELKEKDDIVLKQENPPYSDKEEDYQFLNKKVFITKNGIMFFDGVESLKKQLNPLSGISQWYKQTMKENNIKLLNISPEKILKYGN